MDSAHGMLCDAGDDVGEIGFGVDGIELCRLDKGVHDGGTAASVVGTREGPVSPPEGDGPDGTLGGIIGHIEPSVRGVADERRPAGQGVTERLTEGAFSAALGKDVFHRLFELAKQRERILSSGVKPFFRCLAPYIGFKLEQHFHFFQQVESGS